MNEQISLLSEITAERGTYILLINLMKDCGLKIGKLGLFKFKEGIYFYIGSAQGNGGIRARLKAHLRKDKKKHWHIDHLLAISKIVGVYYLTSTINQECVWSKSLEGCAEVETPVKKFGASDCQEQCAAHLFFVTRSNDINCVEGVIRDCIHERLNYAVL